MTKHSDQPHHDTLIIRAWQEEHDKNWRFRVQNIRQDEQLGFNSLEELVAYLQSHFSDVGLNVEESEK